MKFKKTALSLAVLASTHGAFADTQDQATADENIENVEVWGTQVRASSVFMSEEAIISKQADHLSDLLREIPGVDVGGAHSLNQRITIRSMDDKDINITIDGASQNNYMYHHMGNLQIHADILQAVDIEVGSNSVLNGGLGGSVRFETKSANQLLSADERVGGRVKGTASDNGSDDVSASIWADVGADFDVLAYYNYIEKNNFEVGGGEIKDADGNKVPGTDGKVRGLEGTVNSGLFKLGWDLASNQRLVLGYEAYRDEGDYSYRPDMGLATDSAISSGTGTPLLWPTEYTRDTFTLNYDADFSDHTTVKATLSDNSSSLWRDETGYAQSTIPRFQSFAAVVEGDADNYGLNVLASTSLGVNEFSYGLDYVKYSTNYQASYTSGIQDSSEESSSNSAFFIQDRIALGSQFTLVPGVRYDSVDVDSVVVNKTFSDSSLALALEFQPMDSLLLRLSSTEIFQAPELAEVFVGAGLYDTPNQDINAESGVNSEFSVAYGDDVFGADQFTAGITFFQTQINEYIYDYAVADPENAPRDTWKDNIGDMSITGAEAYLGYQVGALNALLTYATADSDLDAYAQYPQYQGSRLDRSQGDSWSFNLGYDLSAANLALSWNFLIVDDLASVDTNSQLDGAGTDNSKAGYQVHNVSANWQATESLNVILGIDNLFDEYYVSQSSRTGSSFHPVFGDLYLNDYEPGRNIKATVAYQF
ncbi:TonB-dependent receptor domain-containing protein [Agaribacterium sp. ZY112]|uniref:TonB-dependent receptor domain-containing protein n=1 Tax=Agaribacterium sp. ZY112 TaxID=3233574 RepID=UPI00352478A2